jgi:DnaJ-domain-containing protein 1
MFERGRGDGAVAVEVVLDDGQKLQGKVLPPDRALAEILNSTSGFLEFQPIGAERMFIAKSAVQCVRPVNAPSKPQLGAANGDEKPFDPSAILGVAPGASREEVHEAYLRQAKAYHPDRYAAAELPPEVREYLGAMARRINAAHDALESPHKHAAQHEPIFTKAGYGQ